MNECEGDQVENITMESNYDGAEAVLDYTLRLQTHHKISPTVYAAVHSAVSTTPTWTACRNAWLAADGSLSASWLDARSGNEKAQILKHFRRAPAL